MNEQTSFSRYLVALAACVVIIAGMRAAKPILVPILLAAFVGVILSQPLHWLRSLRVPTPIALLIIAAAVGAMGVGVVALVGKSFNDFLDQRLVYQAKLQEQRAQFDHWLEEFEIDWPVAETEAPPRPPLIDSVDTAPILLPTDSSADPVGDLLSLNPQEGVNLLRGLFTELGGIFSNALVILITVIFMLLEASRFPEKLRAALGESSPSISHTAVIIANVRRYMGIKTLTSLVTGVLVSAFLMIYGIDYPLLWGLLAFLFNYVPNIGSILAALPAVALALVQRDATAAAITGCGYLAINGFISYAIEPRFMGQGLGLSTLVVFLSLIFWGWVLGPIGMLLSAPLTMIIKIVLTDYEDTRAIAVLLGAKAPEPKH